MRGVITSFVMMACLCVGCAAPSIGEYPESDTKLPDRKQKADTTSDDSGSSASTTTATQTFKITVTLKGAGAVSSSPAGLTCTGSTCTGTFASGTAVTLTPAPSAASYFSTWSGSCTGGGACAPIVKADTSVTAEFETFDGTWKGTATNMRRAFNCDFTNNGDLEATIASGATTASAKMTGFELRQIPGCALVRTSPGSAGNATMTLAADKMTGTWTFSIQNASGTLDFPFTATFKGKTMTGTWTCDTCTGGFTLQKQP